MGSALCSRFQSQPSLPLLHDTLLHAPNCTFFPFFSPLPPHPAVYGSFTALGSSCAMLSCSAKCIKKEMPPCCGERIYIITTNSESYNARWQTSGEVFFPEYTLLVLSKKPWGMVVYSESTTVYNFCKFFTPKYYSRVKSLWELNVIQSDSLNDFLNDTLCDCFCWREIMRNSPGGKNRS